MIVSTDQQAFSVTILVKVSYDINKSARNINTDSHIRNQLLDKIENVKVSATHRK